MITDILTMTSAVVSKNAPTALLLPNKAPAVSALSTNLTHTQQKNPITDTKTENYI